MPPLLLAGAALAALPADADTRRGIGELCHDDATLFTLGGVLCESTADDGVFTSLDSGERLAGYDAAREEILGCFASFTKAATRKRRKRSILIFDPIGVGCVVGNGLDASLKAVLEELRQNATSSSRSGWWPSFFRSSSAAAGATSKAASLNVLILVDPEAALTPEALYRLYGVAVKPYDSLEAFCDSVLAGGGSPSPPPPSVPPHRLKQSRGRPASVSSISPTRTTRSGTTTTTQRGSGRAYSLFSPFVLLMILLTVGVEFICYVGVLTLTKLFEYLHLTLFVDERVRRAARARRGATSYETWTRASRELDRLQEKRTRPLPSSSIWKGFAERLADDGAAGGGAVAAAADPHLIEDVLRTPSDVLFMEFLYAEDSNRGVNETIRRARMALVKRLEAAKRAAGGAGLPAEWASSFGTTALCLSGGASNSYYSLGVAKALFRENLLPQHLSGASGGALVASLIATRNDEELAQLFTDSHGYRRLSQIFNPAGNSLLKLFVDFARHGTVFDPDVWAFKLKEQVCGDFTFEEAFQKTGRTLTIPLFSVGDDSHHTLFLNHVNAPRVLIRSAVLASSAIPGLLPPVPLLMKLPDSETVVPFTAWGEFFRDGSFQSELPFDELRRVFNVTFTIVSQTNPHLTFFFFESRGSAGTSSSLHRGGSGYRGGFLLSFLERAIKEDMRKWISLVRDFKLLPTVGGADASQIFLGDTYGSVTVFPTLRFSDYYNLAKDPDTPEKMAAYIDAGERRTWPKLGLITDRLSIEHALTEY